MTLRGPVKLGIRPKLIILSFAVVAGIGITILMGWRSLNGLSNTIRYQSDTTTIFSASSDLQQRINVSWLALYRLNTWALSKTGNGSSIFDLITEVKEAADRFLL